MEKSLSSELIAQIKSKLEADFDTNILPNLLDFVRIPNLSRAFDAEWKTNGLLEKAAEFVLDWIKKQSVNNMTVEIVKETDLSPCIFGEIKGSTPEAPTVLFYGHIDKQPPMTGWREGLHPTKPVIEGDKAYGRGISDDGYAPFATISIIRALQELKISHPRCVFLFEGDEESGSGHLPTYLGKLQSRIGNPKVIFGLDSGCLDYNTLWLTGSLRGMVALTMNVKIIKEGVHSGDASGVVPDTMRIIRMLLDRLEDPETGVMHQDLQVHVPSEHYRHAEKVIDLVGDKFFDKFPFLEGVKPVNKDPFESYLNRTWRPTQTVIGIDGLPPTDKAGNVLRPETTVKISWRLPPTLDSKKAIKKLKEILSENPPYGCQITFPVEMGASGWACSAFPDWLVKSLDEGSKAFYDRDMYQYAEGGTIPFMGMIQEKFPEACFVVTGVLGPHSNAHGPNESLDIPYTKKFLCCIARTLADCSVNLK